MEIVVISPETEFPNERDWMVRLFEAGLTRYHVRKPLMTEAKLENHLLEVPGEWRAKVVIHQNHSLVSRCHLGGWHCKDSAAQIAKAGPLLKAREPGKTLSRSIHSITDLNEDLKGWDYVFLSPVFKSISKGDYGPGWEEIQLSAALRHCKETYHTRVFALGGVDDSRVEQCRQMGFDGVALMGAIWQSGHPLQSFLRVREALHTTISR